MIDKWYILMVSRNTGAGGINETVTNQHKQRPTRARVVNLKRPEAPANEVQRSDTATAIKQIKLVGDER